MRLQHKSLRDFELQEQAEQMEFAARSRMEDAEASFCQDLDQRRRMQRQADKVEIARVTAEATASNFLQALGSERRMQQKHLLEVQQLQRSFDEERRVAVAAAEEREVRLFTAYLL